MPYSNKTSFYLLIIIAKKANFARLQKQYLPTIALCKYQLLFNVSDIE